MDTVPLARDAVGSPFPLPDNAVFWRVRRQTGGRPSAVVGPNGEPLFIPIAADLDSLVAAGCAPGSYRLEAVDVQRRSVGTPIAFVEIIEPQTERIGHSDLLRTSIEALTRTTEAMQRTQLERERASAARERELMNAQIEAQRALIESQKSQMHLVVSLFERVTGAGDPVAMLKQQINLQRTLEEQSKQRNAPNAPPEPPVEQAPPWWAAIMAQAAPAVSMWVAGKSRQEIAGALFQQMSVGTPIQAAAAQAHDAVVEAAVPPVSGPSAKEKIQAVLERLTEDERATVKQKLETLTDDEFDRMMRYVAGVSVEEAVGLVRSYLVQANASPSNGHAQS
jgi:hypothetical protein